MNLIKRAVIGGALALASTTAIPAIASAQAAAQIVVVDMERIANDSVAAKSADQQLQAKLQGMESRRDALGNQLRSEAENLQKAKPSMAEAAFKAKVEEYGKHQSAAETELRSRQQDFVNSRNYVSQQILQAVNPIVTAIMREKGASIALKSDAAVGFTKSLEITDDVIARLNKSLPRVSITPPAPAPAKK